MKFIVLIAWSLLTTVAKAQVPTDSVSGKPIFPKVEIQSYYPGGTALGIIT